MRIRKIVFWAVVLPVFLLTACGGEKKPKAYTCSPEVEADLGTIKEAKGPVSFVLKIKKYDIRTDCSLYDGHAVCLPECSGRADTGRSGR